MAKKSKPRRLSLVRFDFDHITATYHKRYPFRRKAVYIFIGEIPNMRDHCIVADAKTGKLYSGYHTEDFVEVPKDEL